jgi:NAD(P)-dependent dehydrogenase (short-subunit alcohol dehydrogenase family)
VPADGGAATLRAARGERCDNEEMTEQTLAGRSIAITGAARGIGLATATQLRALGASVFIGDIDGELAEREAARLGATGLEADVTSEESFAAFIDAATAPSGRLDVLINNAGIMLTGSYLQQKPEAAERMFAVNTLGLMRGTRLALPAMLERHSGQIINISSLAGRAVAPGIVSYCASKHAVVGFTRALQREHKGSGVQFTLIMPAFTRTALTAGLSTGRAPAAKPEQIAAGIVGTIVTPRDEAILPRSSAALVNTLERALPRKWGDKLAHAMGVDEQFIARDGSALQENSREWLKS